MCYSRLFTQSAIFSVDGTLKFSLFFFCSLNRIDWGGSAQCRSLTMTPSGTSQIIFAPTQFAFVFNVSFFFISSFAIFLLILFYVSAYIPSGVRRVIAQTVEQTHSHGWLCESSNRSGAHFSACSLSVVVLIEFAQFFFVFFFLLSLSFSLSSSFIFRLLHFKHK